MSCNKTTNIGPVLIDGHSYPADPSSEAFTNLLMDCFQRGRDSAASKQRQARTLSLVKLMSEVIQQPKSEVAPKRVRSVPKTRRVLKEKANLQLKHA
jgi:hypothetical protein